MAKRKDGDAFPHSLEAEKAVLGSVLVDERAWAVVASQMRAQDFYRDAHAKVFAAMAALAAGARPVDLLTLREHLERDGTLEDVGGVGYLASLTDGVPRGSNVGHYAEIVREKSRLRKLLDVAELVALQARSEKPAAQVADVAVRGLFSAVDARGGGMTNISDAEGEYMDGLAAGTAGKGVATGYTDIDAMTGGFKDGDLVIVAARPSAGKSSLALGAADHIADTTGLVVPFFSLEMSAQALSARRLGWKARVPSRDLERGTATDGDYAKAHESADAHRGKRSTLYIEETSRTVTEIAAWCARAKQEHGKIGAVFVDYMQLMYSDERVDSRQEQVAAISRALKRLARDLSVPVVALSQLSRATEDRRDKRPQLSDLRESGALEQDADLVLLLFREEMYKRTDDNEGIAEAIVAKQRNGPTGVVKLAFLAGLAEFRDLAQQQDLPR